jgi:addiction module HigA family antidote
MANPALRGIDFLFDGSGRKKAVQIDLRRHGEVWEDLYDRLIAEQRRDEPRESLEAVRHRSRRLSLTGLEVHVERHRQPTQPGAILHEEYLSPLRLTRQQVADRVGCDVKVINRIVNGRTGVTAEMAVKLGAAFRTSPDFWLNAQQAVDLHRAKSRVKRLPRPFLRAS